MPTLTPEALQQLKNNPAFFAKHVLHFEPFNYQEKLLTDKAKRVIACMGRQTGKTTTIATKAIHYAFCNPNTTTLIISPSLRQSMIMFDKILRFTHSNPFLRKSITRKTRTIIQLTNGSTIIALPCSEHMLRGYTANLAIADEAAFIPETVLTEIVFPMLSTTNGTAILLSTPWDKNHFFYKAFLNPQYSTHRIRSAENPLIPQGFLSEMEQNMTKEAYKREYQAEFTEAASCYFQQELIRRCIENAQKIGLEPIIDIETQIPKAEYYAGLDLGKLQDYSAIAILQKDAETLKLVYTHQFPLETPYTEVIATTARINQQFQLQKLLVDKTGIGEPVLEELQNQGIPTEGATLTQDSKAELLTNLKLAMEQQHIAIPYDKQLCQQINDQQYTYSKSGKLSFWHPQNTHDDQLWALALAVYAAKAEQQPQLWVIAKTAKTNKTRLRQVRQQLSKHKTQGENR
jgi:phage terminase large subunit-like protein